MTDCANTYLIDRHLKEQEDREAHDMRFVDVVDAWQCCDCHQFHAEKVAAVVCCDGEISYENGVYMCVYCGDMSADIDDIRGHNHD